MAKKITKVSDPITKDDPRGGVLVTLPLGIRENREVVRWLGHWVVDAMVEHRYVHRIADDVEERLGYMGSEIFGTSIADLVRRALKATSKAEESRRSKKAAKGTGKGK